MKKDSTQSTLDELKKEAQPFELIVGDKSGEILNGDIPVRWCVTPKLVSELEEHKVKDAHVLLVTATPKGTEMDRKIVPITELMTYVRFTRAGHMKIYGFILTGAPGRKRLYQTYKRKSEGVPYTDVICNYTNKPFDDIKYEYTRVEVDVIIPSGVFGKEPGPWMKWYVNMWHNMNGRVIDECHYRRRLLLAFTLKWIPVLIWSLSMVVGRFAVCGGLALSGYYKNIKWGRIFQPYKWNNISYHILDCTNDKNAFLLSRSHSCWGDGKYDITMFITVPIIPAVLLGQSLIIWFGLATHATALTFWTVMGFVSLGLLTAAAIYDGGYWAVQAISESKILNNFGTKLDERFSNATQNVATGTVIKVLKWLGYIVVGALLIFAATIWIAIAIYGFPVIIFAVLMWKFGDAWVENMYTVSPENNDYTEIRELLCPKDELNLQADIDFIPPKQRTVRLWYLEMKHKVCKPMQH